MTVENRTFLTAPKYQTQSYITYIYMSIRKVSVSIREDTDACSWAQKDLAKTEKGKGKGVYSFIMTNPLRF